MNKAEIVACIYKHVGNGDLANMLELATDVAEQSAREEREACAKLCEAHAAEAQIVRVTKITDNPFMGAALDCAELIRMRSEKEAFWRSLEGSTCART